MKLKRVLQFAQQLLMESIEEGDIVVDATAGNGHDTLFLAQLVGNQGHVYAFDVQQQAIEATTIRLQEAHLQHRVTIIHDGHEQMTDYVQQPISGAIFNLGYLPGSDHAIITKSDTTILAIEHLLRIMKVGGIVVLVIYYGHEGGASERDAVLQFVQQLPQKYVHVLRYEFINQKNMPPFIIALEKVKHFTSLK